MNFTVIKCCLAKKNWTIFPFFSRCKGWVDEHFTQKEHLSKFKNIQMAIVYNLHETLKKFVQVDDQNITSVEYNINLLMTDVSGV